jgi:DNA-binding NtrC family response regulator
MAKASTEPKSYRVVMVEDDLDLCAGWAEVFDLMGHEIICYHRAADALKSMSQWKEHDVLITDFYLPDMNGVDLIKRVRQTIPHLPVILLTGSRESAVTEAFAAIRDGAILYKPISIDDVEATIQKLTS